MLIKQKQVLVVFGLLMVGAFVSLQATFFTQTAHADYTVSAGQKCDDGSNPQVTTGTVNNTVTLTCADTTRSPANGAQQPNTNGATGGATTPPPAEGTTCAVEKIGWIVCPIMEGVSKTADKTFDLLAKNFLEIEPELLTSNPPSGKGTITAWEMARNIANLAFIIAFLLLIYSQITGGGMSNYGIKRMLPRLIVAAIAVNVSYYICQAMVDISNYLGYETKNALTELAKEIGPAVLGQDTSQGTNTQTADGTLAKITIAVLAVGGIVWLFLAPLGAITMVVLITLLTVICILLLRKAFIVILVVLSPLAFVAYLLPNTEKYFQKWLNMFWQLLMVFPIVALLFGGGQLASTIILVSGANQQTAQQTQAAQNNCNSNGTPQQPAGGGQQQQGSNGYSIECEGTVDIGGQQSGWMLGLVAAGIAIAPLLFVWSVLKGALAAAGAIGGKIAGAIDNAGKGKTDELKKDIKQRKEDRQARQALAAMQNPRSFSNVVSGGAHRRRAFRDARRANVNSEMKRSTEAAVNERINNNEGFARQMAGGNRFSANDAALQRTMDRAELSAENILMEETKASASRMRNDDNGTLRAIVNDPNRTVNDPEVAAAIQHLAERQDFRGLEQALDRFSNQRGIVSQVLSQSLKQHAPEMFTGGQLGDIARGANAGPNRLSYADMVRTNISNGIITAEKAATMGPSMADEVSDIAAGNTNAMNQLRNASQAALSDQILNKKVGRNRTQLTNFSAGRNAQYGRPRPAPTPGTPPPSGYAAW